MTEDGGILSYMKKPLGGTGKMWNTSLNGIS
jgi:hypothetical protein